MTDASAPAFECAAVGVNGTAVIAVRGEVDAATRPELWRCIEAAAAGSDQLVLDLTDVTFMDSSGIGVIARAHQPQGDPPLTIVLRNPRRSVMRLLEITAFDEFVTSQRDDTIR